MTNRMTTSAEALRLADHAAFWAKNGKPEEAINFKARSMAYIAISKHTPVPRVTSKKSQAEFDRRIATARALLATV